MTKNGNFTYCCSRDELLGKGRCNHIAISKIGENENDFIARMQEEIKKMDKTVKIENISKYDFKLADDYFDKKEPATIISEYIHLAAVNLRCKNALINNPKFFFQNADEKPDEEELKALIESYAPKKEAFESMVKDFKDSHPDWYEQIPCQQTFKPTEEEKDRAQKFVDSLTDEEKGYWYFRTKSEVDQYKKYMNGKPEFMTTKKNLKREYKDAYKEFTEQAYASSGYPGEAAIKKQVTKMVPTTKPVQLRAIELELKESSMDSSKIWNE